MLGSQPCLCTAVSVHMFFVGFFLMPAVKEPAESLAMLVETLKYSFVA